ncbi:stalk domain-containing protein [Sporosarcina cascadiensis]|uniref:stalk domain-containing protein n=1 Tax=Sporosarcina cascadiensis TaxID=2660747 RepID=UPI00129B06F6|nr:stalk domain-containing protein [Sporosarcina cascadiensis]
MKKNKFVPFAMSALLISGAAVPAAVFANDDSQAEEVQEQMSFIKVEGTIDSVEKNSDVTLYTLKNGEETNVLAVMKDTLVFDNTGKEAELKKGDQVTAYTDADKPMLMIYPPQYSPDAVIVETDQTGFTAVGTFDKELVDASLKLQLKIGENTEITSVSGKEVKAEDLKDQDLLVFYTATTRSIPAQTTPEKVVVLDGTAADSDEDTNSALEDLIAADHKMVDGVKMVPLRLVAEELGYQVKSTGTGAILVKDAKSLTITRDEKKYGYNKSLRQFEAAPALLETNKTYVPASIVDDLME